MIRQPAPDPAPAHRFIWTGQGPTRASTCVLCGLGVRALMAWLPPCDPPANPTRPAA